MVLLVTPAAGHGVDPEVIRLVDNVTIRGLSSSTATRSPLTSPITMATTKTMAIASANLSVEPFEWPTRML